VTVRVAISEVRTLLDGVADNSNVDLYIEQANLLVNEELAGTGLTDARLRLIELNLAAHFGVVAIERGGFTYQQSMSSQEGYATDRSQVKLSSTRFGQQALVLDSSGKLATLDSPRGTAEFRVM
jgi:hypothetical protein